MMPDQNLMRRIRLGEDSTLEFKTVLFSGPQVDKPDRRSLADELAAFANGRGGTMILGVDDKTHHVQGIPLDCIDSVETWAREICNDLVTPPLDADILKVELEDPKGRLVPVLRIDVERSLFVHKSPGGYFRRIGSSKREMNPEALARIFQERSQTRVIRFDESIVPSTAPSDLHYSLTQRFLRGEVDGEPSSHPHEDAVQTSDDMLRKLRIVTDDPDGTPRLTLAGVLLCTSNPQQWLPHAYIQAVSYAGERTDIDYQTDARDIGGSLDQQIADAMHFVRRNMFVRAAKRVARSERPQFSQRATFEAIVNAVAHRDYSISGSRVRLHMFGDRLELHIPGALSNTLTPSSLHLRQSSRNELIVSLLARCPAPSGLGRTKIMDTRGDGVPIIRQECKALSGRLPEYSLIDDSELRLVIWAAT